MPFNLQSVGFVALLTVAVVVVVGGVYATTDYVTSDYCE